MGWAGLAGVGLAWPGGMPREVKGGPARPERPSQAQVGQRWKGRSSEPPPVASLAYLSLPGPLWPRRPSCGLHGPAWTFLASMGQARPLWPSWACLGTSGLHGSVWAPTRTVNVLRSYQYTCSPCQSGNCPSAKLGPGQADPSYQVKCPT